VAQIEIAAPARDGRRFGRTLQAVKMPVVADSSRRNQQTHSEPA